MTSGLESIETGEEESFSQAFPPPSSLLVDERSAPASSIQSSSDIEKEEEEIKKKKITRKKTNELAKLLQFTDLSLLYQSQEEEAQKNKHLSESETNRSEELKRLIRTKWEYAASMQFLQLFGDDLNVSEFYSEDVEDAFISTNESTLLIELHIKLIKGLMSHNFAPQEWQIVLRKIIDK
jgi:hypothetical protein